MALSVHNILVPVDFSDASEQSLQVAIDLAKTFKANVHLLHVYQVPVYGFPDGAFLAGPDIAAKLSDAAQHGLNLIVEKHRDQGVQLTGVLRQGNPHEEILAVASEVLADLIVLGTHGRSGLSHALLGSVTEKVVRTSPVPVMTIRHRAHG